MPVQLPFAATFFLPRTLDTSFLDINLYLINFDLIEGKTLISSINMCFLLQQIDLIKKIKKQNLLVEIPYLDKLNNPSKIGTYWVKKIVEI